MRRTVFWTALMLAIGTGSALAGNKCDVPADQWQSPDALKAQLESEGWKIRQIKTEDGCYEVYATNADGKRMETYFDPKTLQPVGEDQD